MKQQSLQKITRTFKQGFYAGAILSLLVYIFARILFYEFTFTAWEEVSNFFMIILAGGLMVSAAFIGFVLLETGLEYLSAFRISFPFLSFKRISYSDEMITGSIDELKTAA